MTSSRRSRAAERVDTGHAQLGQLAMIGAVVRLRPIRPNPGVLVPLLADAARSLVHQPTRGGATFGEGTGLSR